MGEERTTANRGVGLVPMFAAMMPDGLVSAALGVAKCPAMVVFTPTKQGHKSCLPNSTPLSSPRINLSDISGGELRSCDKRSSSVSDLCDKLETP